MAHAFPSKEWLEALVKALNSDERYEKVAAKWEADFMFVIEPDKGSSEPELQYYMDLWHGKCRNSFIVEPGKTDEPKPAYTMRATRSQFMQVLKGDLDPMQAMLTRRLRVEGNMAYLLRNVPVVLDFVRCAGTIEIAE
jgi:putative sterol carrier protein